MKIHDREPKAIASNGTNVVPFRGARRTEEVSESPSKALVRRILDVEMDAVDIPAERRKDLEARTNGFISNIVSYLIAAGKPHNQGATPEESERILFKTAVHALYGQQGTTSIHEPILLHEAVPGKTFGIYSSAALMVAALVDIGHGVSLMLRPERNVLIAGQHNLIDIVGTPLLTRHVLSMDYMHRYPRRIECSINELVGLAWHVAGIKLMGLGRDKEAVDAFINAKHILTPYAPPIFYLAHIAEERGWKDLKMRLDAEALAVLSSGNDSTLEDILKK